MELDESLEHKVREKYRKLTLYLIEKGLFVTAMESCTGGMIASLITDTEGASSIIKGAFVTYSNEAKIRMGVPAEVIKEHTVYSKETAMAMAASCADLYDADIGIGITGTFGNPDPSTPSSVRKVYFAFCCRGKCEAFEVQLREMPTRHEYKLLAASEVCDRLSIILKDM